VRYRPYGDTRTRLAPETFDRRTGPRFGAGSSSSFGLRGKHPDDDRARHPILLEVDDELGKRSRARLRPKVPDPHCAVEVPEHRYVQQFARATGGKVPGRSRSSSLKFRNGRHRATVVSDADSRFARQRLVHMTVAVLSGRSPHGPLCRTERPVRGQDAARRRCLTLRSPSPVAG
jgi:hypothetical protein